MLDQWTFGKCLRKILLRSASIYRLHVSYPLCHLNSHHSEVECRNDSLERVDDLARSREVLNRLAEHSEILWRNLAKDFIGVIVHPHVQHCCVAHLLVASPGHLGRLVGIRGDE